MPKTKKIVYILGAGFSKPCGIPEQIEILPKILAKATDPLLKNFLIKLFGHSKNIPLEDVFTALDKAINNDQMIHNFDRVKLLNVRRIFTKRIIEIFNEIKPNDRSNYINLFAEKLIAIRKNQDDPIAIISTNWDTLLDNAIETIIIKNNNQSNKRDTFLDYCTFTHSIDSSNPYPSTRIKVLGFKNIKLLKMHGSVNWLLCPNCESLYFVLDTNSVTQKKINISICKSCSKNHSLRIDLRPILISPTFIKDFNNVHLRTIWWNAAFELSEATHIVFIGYSFPLSDFELRYLFARSILKKNTKIKVILFSKNPSRPDRNAQITRERYVNFFGNMINKKHDISFHGVENFVKNLQTEDIFW